MKRGFFTIMSAQFFSSLADNALFVAAVELLRQGGAAEWQRAALVPMFALFYVILAPFVGAFADSVPKGKVMFFSNSIKVVGCLMMLFGSHPLLAYAVVLAVGSVTAASAGSLAAVRRVVAGSKIGCANTPRRCAAVGTVLTRTMPVFNRVPCQSAKKKVLFLPL